MIGRLFDPRYGLAVFSGALFLFYFAVPLCVYAFLTEEPAFLQLALLTVVALISMFVGNILPIFDYRFKPQATRVVIDQRLFVGVAWLIFLVFILVTFSTAPSIPFLSSLLGADANTLSEERGAFLKGREGAGIALLYISTFLVNTIVPYSTVLLYASRSLARHAAAIVFFLFCISFMQKALFLNMLLPLIAYFSTIKRIRSGVVAAAIAGAIFVLIASTYLSLGGVEGGADSGADNYFSASYSPQDPLQYFFWRVLAVPVFTATDTLIVYREQFSGTPLLGATSSFISAIFGLERINIERYVFQYQFGSWNETANANAVFLVDLYVNFGIVGVIFFGGVVGQIFRWFRLSPDIGFRSLWTIFSLVLFSAPLIGMLLSNGFLYMLAHALLIKIKPQVEYDAKD